MTHSRLPFAIGILLALLLAACHKENFEDHQRNEFAETEKKAEGGDVPSIYQTASAYESGSGVTQDYAKAMEWYKKGADKGDDSCMFNIGVMYREGRGVPKDINLTVEWFLKSAAAGAGVAWYNLGMMYYK
jgi:TPR repeat protein